MTIRQKNKKQKEKKSKRQKVDKKTKTTKRVRYCDVNYQGSFTLLFITEPFQRAEVLNVNDSFLFCFVGDGIGLGLAGWLAGVTLLQLLNYICDEAAPHQMTKIKRGNLLFCPSSEYASIHLTNDAEVRNNTTFKTKLWFK